MVFFLSGTSTKNFTVLVIDMSEWCSILVKIKIFLYEESLLALDFGTAPVFSFFSQGNVIFFFTTSGCVMLSGSFPSLLSTGVP